MLTELEAVVLVTVVKERLQRLGIAFEFKPGFTAGIAAKQEGTKVATAGFNYSFEIWN